MRALRFRAVAPLLAMTIAVVALPPSTAAAKREVVSIRTVEVSAPGNASVGIVPFTDAVYESCADAPPSTQGCQMVGGVDRRFEIGQLEVTVDEWVKFLNTVDRNGRNRFHLYRNIQSSSEWPKYGSIDYSAGAKRGRHYSVAYPEWSDKPYAFADFVIAARFANSLYNGKVLKQTTAAESGVEVTTYKVRLSRRTERGMYNLRRERTGRTKRSGFTIPSQDEWIKAAYYDPSGGGTYSYWKYPTNAGVFGDGTATAPSSTTLDPTSGDVTNAATQPLATYHADDEPAPSWCPSQVTADECPSVNPFGIDPTTYADAYQGSVSTVGQARTRSPWGTFDQGGNVVEWTDTITAAPSGRTTGRVWRRAHGGVSNAPAYQLWLSAIGPQPQRNTFFKYTYPWLGFRVGVIGNVGP